MDNLIQAENDPCCQQGEVYIDYRSLVVKTGDNSPCVLITIGMDEYSDQDILGTLNEFQENGNNWRDLLSS